MPRRREIGDHTDTLKPLSTLCSLWRWQLWERLRRRCRCHNCGLRRCLSAHPLQGRVESRFQLILQYKERKKEMGVIFVISTLAHGSCSSSEPQKLPGCPREKLEENLQVYRSNILSYVLFLLTFLPKLWWTRYIFNHRTRVCNDMQFMHVGTPPTQQEKDQAERNIVNSPINPERVYAFAWSVVYSTARSPR